MGFDVVVDVLLLFCLRRTAVAVGSDGLTTTLAADSITENEFAVGVRIKISNSKPHTDDDDDDDTQTDDDTEATEEEAAIVYDRWETGI